ncbi:MAG: hypothetical protein KKG47_00130 [Proteobacteria bacterium]|nr:hypothetical protein [Pseudomonadota bacterium]MBU1738502.1 hypothetical protein [Pseudomonadota bacterium]
MNTITKKLILTSAILMSTMTVIPAMALAEDKPTADFTTGIYSDYVWRGYALSDDSVVIQPSMTVSYKGFAANLWGSLDTDYLNTDEKNWLETDMTLSYEGSAGKIGYGAGWIYYEVDGADDTQEGYVSVSVDTILAPSLTVYVNLEDTSAYYSTLGISHSLPLAEGMALDLGAQVGYLDNGASYNEFHDALLSASMSFAVAEYISVTPELYYSFALTSDSETNIKAGSADNDDNHFYGGISASLAF